MHTIIWPSIFIFSYAIIGLESNDLIVNAPGGVPVIIMRTKTAFSWTSKAKLVIFRIENMGNGGGGYFWKEGRIELFSYNDVMKRVITKLLTPVNWVVGEVPCQWTLGFTVGLEALSAQIKKFNFHSTSIEVLKHY